MVMAMTINPGCRINVNADHIPKNHDGLDECGPVVERFVSNAHVDDVREIKSAHEPNKDQVEECDSGAEQWRPAVRRKNSSTQAGQDDQ